MAETDLALLQRYRDTGDGDAFGEIVRRYAGAVFATCNRILHDPPSAEDAAQETFFRLMTRPQRVSASVGGWLHRAATRLALDIRRSDIARRRREANHETFEPLEASTWAELAPKLDEALAALPEQQRDLLVRHFLRGEAQADLAMELGTSPATMSRRIKSAIELLREDLQRRGVSMSPAVLFLVLGQNGPATVVPSGLKLGLGKMSLLCQARMAGQSQWSKPLSLIGAMRGAPQFIYALRWALLTALFCVLAAMLGAMALERIAMRHPSPGVSQLQAEPREPRSLAASTPDRRIADNGPRNILK